MDTYWHTYYDADTIARSNQLCRTVNVTSTDVTLHVDCYEQPTDAPVLTLNHWATGDAYVQMWCDLVDEWCRAHRPTHSTSIGSTST
jgi:hypothetical protein